MKDSDDGYFTHVEIAGDRYCSCGNLMYVEGVSNWHDNTGVYYMRCEKCNTKKNLRWRTNNYYALREIRSLCENGMISDTDKLDEIHKLVDSLIYFDEQDMKIKEG